MIKLFDYLEKYFSKESHERTTGEKLKLFLLAPLHFVGEWLVKRDIWDNTIISEIFTSDTIVEFLDKEEFGLLEGTNIIAKHDLIESNEYFDAMDLKEAKVLIKAEYLGAFNNLFKNNCLFNVEDYISMLVFTENKYVRSHEGAGKARCYTVMLQFCRYQYYKEAKRRFLMWLIFFGVITSFALFIVYKWYLCRI